MVTCREMRLKKKKTKYKYNYVVFLINFLRQCKSYGCKFYFLKAGSSSYYEKLFGNIIYTGKYDIK